MFVHSKLISRFFLPEKSQGGGRAWWVMRLLPSFSLSPLICVLSFNHKEEEYITRLSTLLGVTHYSRCTSGLTGNPGTRPTSYFFAYHNWVSQIGTDLVPNSGPTKEIQRDQMRSSLGWIPWKKNRRGIVISPSQISSFEFHHSQLPIPWK